jgi:hypothetical protein
MRLAPASLTTAMNSRFAAIRQAYERPEQPNISRAARPSSSFFNPRQANNSQLDSQDQGPVVLLSSSPFLLNGSTLDENDGDNENEYNLQALIAITPTPAATRVDAPILSNGKRARFGMFGGSHHTKSTMTTRRA